MSIETGLLIPKVRKRKYTKLETLISALRTFILVELKEHGTRGANIECLIRQLRSKGYLLVTPSQVEENDINAFVEAFNDLLKQGEIKAELANNHCGQVVVSFVVTS